LVIGKVNFKHDYKYTQRLKVSFNLENHLFLDCMGDASGRVEASFNFWPNVIAYFIR